MKKTLILLVVTILLSATSAYSQATYSISDSGDTINITDMKGMKQGYWETKVGSQTIRGHYVNSVKEGAWLTYHPRGFLSKLENYKHGKKDGIFITIDTRGYLNKEEFYKDDKLDGLAVV